MAIRLLSNETIDGNITSTGATITLDSSGSASYIADRANDTSGATYEYKTNGSLKWYTGLRGVSTEDFYLFNNAQGSTALLFNSSNNNATFAGSVDIGTFTISGSGIIADSGMTLQVGGGSVNALTLSSSGDATFSGSVKGTIAMFNTLNNQANSANIIYRTGTTTVVGGGSSSNKLYVLDNGDVGVNLSSPSEKLDVDGSVKIGNMKLQNANGGRIGFNRNTANGVIYDSNFSAFQINGASSGIDYLSFEAYNSSGTFQNQMVYTSSGNLGIGVTSVDAKLHLNTGGSGLINQKFESAGSAAWRLGIPASQTYFAFDNANDNLSTPKMVINSSGNVGIGYNNPTAKLSVNGDGGFVSNSSSRVLYLTQDAANSGNIIQFLDQNGSNIWELVGRNNQFYIYNNALNAFAMYISPNTNNIGIGTNNTGNKLNVPGTINLHSLGFVDVDPLNSGTGNIWSKIGTWSTGQGGRNLSLKLAAGSGYNASLSQNGELHLELRTSNGAATAPNISGRWWIEGQNLFVDNVRVKEVSTSEYEVYVRHQAFIGAGNIQVDVGDIDNWDSDVSYNTGIPTGTLLNPSQINYFRGDQYAINSNIITTGNFCVDTTSPTHALTIDRASGGIDLRGGNNRIYFTGYRAIEGASNGTLLQIGESYSNTALYGNVGIGTTTPTYRLSIEHSTASGGIRTVAGFSAGTGNMSGDGSQINLTNWNDNYGGFIRTVNTQSTPNYLNPKMEFGLNYNNYLPADMGVKMVIMGSGLVGINNTNPSYTLDVTGSIRATSSFVRVSTAPDIWYSNSNTGTYTQTVAYMNQSNSSNTDSNGYFLERGRISNSSTAEIRRWVIGARGGQKQMMLDGPGTLTVAGDLVAYGSPSDKRYKENIKPVTNALDKVSKLQGVTFDWKESESILDIKEDIGFIAQDVQEVLPELVRENEDGKLSLRDKGIVPILVEAIKELKAEIEELKNNK